MLSESFALRVKRYITSRKYKLAILEDYATQKGYKVKKIIPEKIIHSERPRFFGGNDHLDLSIYDGISISSEVKMVRIPNCIAVGRSEFLIKDGHALYPSPFDHKLYTFMLELEGRAKVHLRNSKISLALKSRPKKADIVISLLGQCNGNYAHWVLEVLARLAVIETMPDLIGIPILVDDPGHETLKSALFELNISGREIIYVRAAQKVEANEIIFVTSPSFTPPETRRFFETKKLDKPRANQFRFSPEAIRYLRDIRRQALEFSAPSRNRSEAFSVSKTKTSLIYIPRNPLTTGNGRHISNVGLVETLLSERDFFFVDIAALGFVEQMSALEDAKVVVSAAGAALANLVFCKPGVKVVLLSPQYRGANWWYWVNLMAAIGHRLFIVLGPQVGAASGEVYHQNFRVNLKLLDAAITEALRDEVPPVVR